MKVLLINGSPNEHGCTYTALSETAETLQKHGIDTEILYLGKKPVAGCIACGKCRETGKCVFDDKVNEVIASAFGTRAVGHDLPFPFCAQYFFHISNGICLSDDSQLIPQLKN